MAERRCSVAARGGGEGNEKHTCELVEQADGGSSNGQQCQDSRSAWLRGQVAGDGWRHVAVDF